MIAKVLAPNPRQMSVAVTNMTRPSRRTFLWSCKCCQSKEQAVYQNGIGPRKSLRWGGMQRLQGFLGHVRRVAGQQ